MRCAGGGKALGVGDARVHHVGVHPVRVACHARHFSERPGQGARIRMVLGEAVDHGVESDQAGGSDDARLAHAAAEHLAPAPSFMDIRLRSTEHAAHRAGQTLGQAEGHTVGARDDIACAHPGGDGCVEQTRAVEVHTQPVGARAVAQCTQLVASPHCATVAVVRVLDAHRCERREMRVIGRERSVDLRGADYSAIGGNRRDVNAADHRCAAGLIQERVRQRVGEHCMTAGHVDEQTDAVAHGAADHQHRRLGPEHLRRPLLEPVDGGVLAVHVVAELGIGHCVTHLRRRLGHSVRSQVDELHSRATPDSRHISFADMIRRATGSRDRQRSKERAVVPRG